MNILSLIYLIFGTNNAPVHDLRKKPTKEDNLRSFNCWVQRNFYILCFIVLLACVVVLVALTLQGFCAVESGTMRNFIAGGV